MQKLTIIVIACIMTAVFVCGMFASSILNQAANTDKPQTTDTSDHTNESPILGGINSPAYSSNNLQVFVKIDGITGESTDAQHLGWIEATYYNYTSLGNSADNNFFAFIAETSKATPTLFRHSMGSNTINKATIAVQSTNPNGTATDIITWNLQDVKLSLTSSAFNSADQKSMDTCIMKCGKAEVKYIELDENGKIASYTASSWIFTTIKG